MSSQSIRGEKKLSSLLIFFSDQIEAEDVHLIIRAHLRIEGKRRERGRCARQLTLSLSLFFPPWFKCKSTKSCIERWTSVRAWLIGRCNRREREWKQIQISLKNDEGVSIGQIGERGRGKVMKQRRRLIRTRGRERGKGKIFRVSCSDGGSSFFREKYRQSLSSQIGNWKKWGRERGKREKEERREEKRERETNDQQKSNTCVTWLHWTNLD